MNEIKINDSLYILEGDGYIFLSSLPSINGKVRNDAKVFVLNDDKMGISFKIINPEFLLKHGL